MKQYIVIETFKNVGPVHFEQLLKPLSSNTRTHLVNKHGVVMSTLV